MTTWNEVGRSAASWVKLAFQSRKQIKDVIFTDNLNTGAWSGELLSAHQSQTFLDEVAVVAQSVTWSQIPHTV